MWHIRQGYHVTRFSDFCQSGACDRATLTSFSDCSQSGACDRATLTSFSDCCQNGAYVSAVVTCFYDYNRHTICAAAEEALTTVAKMGHNTL